MRLGNAALAQELETSLGQVDDLSFVLLFNLGIRNLAVGDESNVFNDIVSLSDLTNQSLVFGFEQL